MLNDPTFLEKLRVWTESVAAVAAAQATERRLRQEVFAAAFPTPKEGTNNAELPGNWKLTAKLPINRSIDLALLPAAFAQIRGMGVNPDPVVKYNPEVVMKEYKALPPEARLIFDTALTIKPGMPQMELVAPKPKE